MSNIPIEKNVFDKIAFSKIINTKFSQLINQENEADTSVFTLEDFFQLYEQLFYQIPKEGDTNSHKYILQKEADYLGIIISEEDIQALLEEITILRQELLDAQTTINELSKTIGA